MPGQCEELIMWSCCPGTRQIDLSYALIHPARRKSTGSRMSDIRKARVAAIPIFSPSPPTCATLPHLN